MKGIIILSKNMKEYTKAALKKLFLFSIIVVCLMACATKKQSVFTNLDCDKYPVLDSLGYIEYTDDYLFTGKVFDQINQKGKVLVPCLIEKVKDTTPTYFRYTEICNFTEGDYAFFMLPYALKSKRDIYKEVVLKEFKKEYKSDAYMYDYLQAILFHTQDKTTTYTNRLRLYKRLKTWYLRKYEKPQKSTKPILTTNG